MRLSIFATLVATVYASPLAPELNERANGIGFCSRVSKAVSKGSCQSEASSWCSSYVGSTVTTAIATTTVSTTTTTVTVTTSCGLPSPTLDKRAKHSPKPACLNSFTGPKPLSSACSCLHVTRATTTITSTNSVTATSTVTSTFATSPSSFYVYATPLAKYGKLTNPNQDGTTAFTEADDDTADIYSVTAGDGYLTSDTGSPGYFAEQGAGSDTEAIFFWDLDSIERNSASFERVTCVIASAGDGTCPLSCRGPFNGGYVNSIDFGNAWQLGQSSAGIEFTPLIVDAGGS